MISRDAIFLQLFPLLNAADAADLVFWDITQVEEFLDKAFERLGLVSGGFVEKATISVVADVSTYSLPARHLSTIRLSIAGLRLQPASTTELEALDSGWSTRQCDPGSSPTHFVRDQQGLAQVRIWPTPEADATASLIYQTYPDTTESIVTISGPLCLQDAPMFAALAGLRGHESKGAMPEVAAWCQQFLEQAYYPTAAKLWGGAQ